MRVLSAILLVVPGLLVAQIPRVGAIDFYGLHKVSRDRVRKALGVSQGDRLPASKGDLEQRLEKIPGVIEAYVEAVCCQAGQTVLYVGLLERGAPHFDFRDLPHGTIKLPQAVTAAYNDFLTSLESAARQGQADEDLRQGHALSADPAVRAVQERFVGLAKTYLETLRQVLRQSDDAEQRAAAAYVIAYFRDKQQIVPDLQYALQDADEGVRANAIRALGPIAALGSREPQLGIRVQPTWFIELLNSIVWSDRSRAADALVSLTERRRPEVLEQLRERSLRSLVEMARWTTLRDALPAFILVGRIAGLPEDQIHAFWNRGDRDTVIRQALRNAPRSDR